MNWERIEPWDYIVSHVADEYRKKFSMVDREDIRQSLYEWFVLHPVKLTEWESFSKKSAQNLLYRSLRNQALDYCQFWKAKTLGYELSDIFFYDAAGARFENLQYAAAGSGSVQIRGAFEYIVRTKGDFSQMTLETALAEALHLLEIAADLDSATGGAGKVLPLARTVTAAGVTEISDDAIRAALGASTTTATSI